MILSGCFFRVIITPPTIALIAPADNAIDQPTTLLLTWEATAGAAQNRRDTEVTLSGYRVYFARSTEEYGEPENTTEKQMQKTGLALNTPYKWKVIAIQSDGQATESAEWTITTQGPHYTSPTIALISPVNEATGQATEVTLTWVATPGAQINTGERDASIAEYLVYFDLQDSGFGSPATVTSHQQQRTNLAYGSTYKWQVVAIQSDGQRATSAEWTFATVDRLYGAPEIALIAPGNGEMNQPRTLTLTWNATPGEQTNQGERENAIEEYRVYFARRGDRYGEPERVIRTQIEKASLDYGIRYKWKVTAVQSDGKQTTSAERTFTTANRLYGAPEIALTGPSSGATDQATAVTLTWVATPGAQTNVGERVASLTEFRVFHAKTGEAYASPVTTTDNSYELTNLATNTEYTYKVQAVQSDGKTAETPEATLMTRTGPIVRYNASGDYQRSYHYLSVAINEANGKDIIEVDGGTLLNNETKQVAIAGAEVTIRSSDETPFTIDMIQQDRVFDITGGASVTMSEAIITGGATASGRHGGGVSLTGSSTLTTRNATIASNTANNGGGVYVNNGTFNAINTAITSNTASNANGGGVYVTDGTFNATDTTIASNTVKGTFRYGGGVYVTNGTFNAVDATITANMAINSANCGGVYVYTNGVFNAENTTITSNTANDQRGSCGGVYVREGTFNATGTMIASNSAGFGSGVFVHNGTATAVDTVIASNTAVVGGGVYVNTGVFTAIHTTIAVNTVTPDNNGDYGNGSGVFVYDGTFTATDRTLIASNTATNDGGGVYLGLSAIFNADSVTIQGNGATAGSGGGIYLTPSQAGIYTSGNLWTAVNKPNAFSVSGAGVIHDDPQNYPDDPVQVFDNTALSSPNTHQMGIE